MQLPKNISFVDIETTGSRVNIDRIIEIGIIRVENNKIVKEYQTLLNPHTHVPPFIEAMTGIKVVDLEEAPTFNQVKDEIQEILNDCFFVAHNVRFDYGFVRNEFRRHEVSYTAKHFCTVRLSRALFPQYAHHNLDSLIERFNIECAHRHRAFDDAKVLWHFFTEIQKLFSKSTLEKTFESVLKSPSTPNVSFDTIDSLSESSGIYIFYDKQNLPLYVGKSINIRDRVVSHFNNDHNSSREMNLCQETYEIQTVITPGELGALLMESLLVKELRPIYNRKLRYTRKLIVLRKIVDTDGYNSIAIEEVSNVNVDELDDIYGVFRSKKQAKEYLLEVAKNQHLCQKRLGLQSTKTACFFYHLGWCKGACVGKESTNRYNLRFIAALSDRRIKPWPFDGAIMIT